MKGSCLCAAVTVTIPERPHHINICNCRLCRSCGVACAYFAPESVTIEGEVRSFERNDIGEVWLTIHFCPICGSTTHWTAAGRAPRDRVGVNIRLFDLDVLDGAEVRYLDGRSVNDESDDFVTMATGCIGDGKAF